MSKFHIKANQKYLKFHRLVILNSFQDLTLWTKQDADIMKTLFLQIV